MNVYYRYSEQESKIQTFMKHITSDFGVGVTTKITVWK
jgi:hypothetical protein